MKVIFDTNFWSYLAESEHETAFVKLEKALKLKIILPPSMLLEVQKTKDKVKRLKIIKTMNKGYRKKSRTEVDLESKELANEIRRLRPECRNIIPYRQKRIRELRKSWTKDIWNNSIENTRFYRRGGVNSENMSVGIISEQEANKKKMQEAKWDVNKTRPSRIKGKFAEEDTFASRYADASKEYEPWRLGNLYYYKKYLAYDFLPKGHEMRTVADWCEPWINIRKFLRNERRYCEFWLEEVEISHMQRHWLRWAIRAIQPLRKISDGNPYDEQHSAYLIGTDVFYTCDRRYYDCLTVIYDDHMVNMARPVLIKADMNKALQRVEDVSKNVI